MKITLINGNLRHGSTRHCADAIVQELAKLDKNKENEVVEFFLPRDMPQFCRGCFSCIYNGEHTCPHAESVQPIAQAMLSADVVILTSPVYAMDISGQMKALLDHLCYMWMSHRPNPAMFNKIGVTICTTAGAGLKHTAKTLQNSLKFWGVKRIFSYSNPVAARKWSEIKPEKQQRISCDVAAMAKRIAKAVSGVEKLGAPLFRSFFLWMMRGMMSKNTWNLRDRKHWEDQGWITAAPAQSGEA
jgi:multimeric flavodoxin WrbA